MRCGRSWRTLSRRVYRRGTNGIATNQLVHQWVVENGFEFFAKEGFRSVTLTCVRNNREIDLAKFVQRLRQEFGFQIDGGYGKIKGKTFRISNMGDETPQTMQPLLNAMTRCL